MYRVLFVCHGNICRSTMAESVFTYLLEQEGIEGVSVNSAATHTDELGNPPHRGTRDKLKREGVPLVPHRATLLSRADGEKYDLFLGMDEYNVRDMKYILGEQYADKVFLLLDFTPAPRAIADPWYTGDFDATFRDVTEGCRGLLRFMRDRGYVRS